MDHYFLKFTLESDAAFGRGDGVAGVVDNEVQHDDLGCPYLSATEIKGILVEECANILGGFPDRQRARWDEAAGRLFGRSGSMLGSDGCVHFADAQLPEDLRMALNLQKQMKVDDLDQEDEHYLADKAEVENGFRQEVLESLTTIRQQTAIDESSGAAKDHSLRAIRVILRGIPFESELIYSSPTSECVDVERCKQDDITLLHACIKAFRRAGTGRTRGRGRLKAVLLGADRKPVIGYDIQCMAEEVQS